MSEALVDTGTVSGAVAEMAPILQGNIGRKVLKNSVAQLVGRFVVAFTRFIMVAAILRTGGRTLFAQYSVVIGVLSLGEWLVDFGTTDAFTREVCRESQNSSKLLRTMTALKLLQFPMAFAILAAMLLAFRYPAVVVHAGLVGGLSLFWFSGVLVYRVVFRSRMSVEREVLAEFLSTLFLVPSTLLVCHYGLGLVAIFWSYFASRIVFFLFCYWFGRRSFPLSIESITTADVRWSILTSFAIGVAGFLAVGYETTDILLLSRFGSVSDVAFYSGAQKLVTPIMMAVAAVASTFYPVFASYWPHDKRQFQETCQRALDLVLVLSGLLVAPVFAASAFFMRLLGPQLADGAIALKGMALLCFLKTVTITLGPILYIVFAQRQLLKMVGIALVVKALLISLLVRHFGYLAVIAINVLLEITFAAFTIRMIHGFTQWKVRPKTGIKVVLSLVAAVSLPAAVHLHGIPAACAAVIVYAACIASVRVIHMSEVRQLLARNPVAVPAS